MSLLSFGKSEKLKSRKAISRLFREGKSFSVYPLRVIFFMDDTAPHAAMPKFTCSVSKRYFKSAVSRNLLKRRMREAYRLHKSNLHRVERKGQLEMMVIFTGKNLVNYLVIEKAMQKAIGKLKQRSRV